MKKVVSSNWLLTTDVLEMVSEDTKGDVITSRAVSKSLARICLLQRFIFWTVLHSMQLPKLSSDGCTLLSCLALSLAPSLEPHFSLFSSCLALSFAPFLEPDFSLFSCFSSSCLSLAPSLKPFLLALILFTIHLEYRRITNTQSSSIGFLSTSEMSTVCIIYAML